MAGQRTSRIAQVYLQIAPMLDPQFTKKLAKDLEAISKAVSFEGLEDALNDAMVIDDAEFAKKTEKAINGSMKRIKKTMGDAGEDGGKALIEGIDDRIGDFIPQVNTRGVITQSAHHGQDAGRALRKAMDVGIGNTVPEVNSRGIIGEAGNDGKRAGKKLADAYEAQVKGANPQLPAPNPPPTSTVAAAGATAGSTFADSFKESLKGMGDEIAGILTGAGAIAIGSKGLALAKEWESGNKEIAASLALTESQAESVSAITKNLYKQAYGEDMFAVEEAIESVLGGLDMIGASDGQIEKMTKKVLTLEQAFEVDIPRATAVAGQMVKTGMAKDAEEALDLFTATLGKIAPASREVLIDSMDEFSDAMQNLGIRGKSAMEMLVILGKKGPKAVEYGADALNEFGIKATTVDEAMGEAYKSIGLNNKQMSLDILAGGERAEKAFDLIAAKLLSIKNPAKQAELAVAFFGSPLESMGKHNVPAFLEAINATGESMGDVSASADTLHDSMRNTFDQRWNEALRTVEVTLAEAFLPLLEKMIPMLESFAGWITENADAIVAWIPWLTLAGVLLGGLVAIGFGALSIAGLGAMFTGVGVGISAIAGGLAAAGGAIATFTAFMWPFIAAMTASLLPVLGWILAIGILAGMVAFVVALFVDFDGTIKWAGEGIQGLMDKMGGFGDVLYAIGAVIVNIVTGVVNGIFWIINAALQGINAVSGLFGGNAISLIGYVEYVPLAKPQMATGGDVLYRPGGTDVTVGEKDPETIVNRGVMNANLAAQNDLIGAILKDGGGGVSATPVINVYQQPGQSPEALARIVVQQLDWENKR